MQSTALRRTVPTISSAALLLLLAALLLSANLLLWTDPAAAETGASPPVKAAALDGPASFAFGDIVVSTEPRWFAGDSDIAVDQVFRLYRVVLSREPDLEGWSYWFGQLATDQRSLTGMARGFARSDEFIRTFGNSDHDVLVNLYRLALGREPDPAGLAYWTARVDDIGIGKVVVHFAESPEFRTALDDVFRRVPSAAVRTSPQDKMRQIITGVFPRHEWDNAIAIASCESELHPDKQHRNSGGRYPGSIDSGLFQINDTSNRQNYAGLLASGLLPTEVAERVRGRSLHDSLLDPEFNTWMAFYITETETWRADAGSLAPWRRQRWGSWTCASPAHEDVFSSY